MWTKEGRRKEGRKSIFHNHGEGVQQTSFDLSTHFLWNLSILAIGIVLIVYYIFTAWSWTLQVNNWSRNGPLHKLEQSASVPWNWDWDSEWKRALACLSHWVCSLENLGAEEGHVFHHVNRGQRSPSTKSKEWSGCSKKSRDKNQEVQEGKYYLNFYCPSFPGSWGPVMSLPLGSLNLPSVFPVNFFI